MCWLLLLQNLQSIYDIFYFIVTLCYQEMKTRRDQIVSQLNQFQSEVDVVMNFLKDDKVMKNMETMRDPKTLSTYLTNEFNVSVICILHKL